MKVNVKRFQRISVPGPEGNPCPHTSYHSSWGSIFNQHKWRVAAGDISSQKCENYEEQSLLGLDVLWSLRPLFPSVTAHSGGSGGGRSARQGAPQSSCVVRFWKGFLSPPRWNIFTIVFFRPDFIPFPPPNL